MDTTITMRSKPTSRQLFVMREYLKPWSCVQIQSAYNQSVWNLCRKGLMRFNDQRGRYEVTPEGVAAVEAEQARRSNHEE